MVTVPCQIYFLYGDESYRELLHREVLEGSYPEAQDEIAADRYTLGNLGLSGETGDTLSIGGTDYIVTGIV